MSYLSVTTRQRAAAGQQAWAAPTQSAPRPVSWQAAWQFCPAHPSWARRGACRGVCSQGPEVPKLSLSMFVPPPPPASMRAGEGTVAPAAAASSSAQLPQQKPLKAPAGRDGGDPLPGSRARGTVWRQSPCAQASLSCPWCGWQAAPFWADPAMRTLMAKSPVTKPQPRGPSGDSGGGGNREGGSSCSWDQLRPPKALRAPTHAETPPASSSRGQEGSQDPQSACTRPR